MARKETPRTCPHLFQEGGAGMKTSEAKIRRKLSRGEHLVVAERLFYFDSKGNGNLDRDEPLICRCKECQKRECEQAQAIFESGH